MSSVTTAKSSSVEPKTLETARENVPVVPAEIDQPSLDPRPESAPTAIVPPTKETAAPIDLASVTILATPVQAEPSREMSKDTENDPIEIPPAPPVQELKEPMAKSALPNPTVSPVSAAADTTPVSVSATPAVASLPIPQPSTEPPKVSRVPRRKPGARECMQISRKFGAQVIPNKYIQILMVSACLKFGQF